MSAPVLKVALALAALAALTAVPAVLTAQHGDGPAALVTHAPKEAGQYDFMIGQWTLVVKPKAQGLGQKIHGTPKLAGTWKAWRALDGWGIQDELRIVDASGNPMAMTEFVRVYDAAEKHWKLAAIEAFHGIVTTSTAEWNGTEMVTSGTGTNSDGKPYQSRVRIYGITPTAFKYSQDRSFDGGKTWDEGYLAIEATRSAATAAR